jgi:hypothetical protein
MDKIISRSLETNLSLVISMDSKHLMLIVSSMVVLVFGEKEFFNFDK